MTQPLVEPGRGGLDHVLKPLELDLERLRVRDEVALAALAQHGALRRAEPLDPHGEHDRDEEREQRNRPRRERDYAYGRGQVVGHGGSIATAWAASVRPVAGPTGLPPGSASGEHDLVGGLVVVGDLLSGN